MSFRRDHDTELTWRRWVKAHQNELIAIGIPREVWSDRVTWWQFVDHGYHPAVANTREVCFSVGNLTDEQQHRLYRFLDTILPDAPRRYGYALWYELHGRFGTVDDHRE